MHPLCFHIKEPEANDDLIGEQEAYMTAILERYMQRMHERTKHHLGYPINMDFNYSALGQLLQFSINNVGDPFIEGNYGVHSREYEIGVLDWFAQLWEIGKDEYWGYITSGGTEGNLHGILVGREVFPDGILYASKDSHYSIFKAAHMYRMDIKIIETVVSGEINYHILNDLLLQHKDKPAIVNINIGTTFKGAIDDLDLVIQTLEKCGFPRNRFYIHCDGAFSGVMVQKLKAVPLITFKKPIDSVSVSGHKFVGCPMPCGVQIVRRKHINAVSEAVEYLASRDATILGSRNGHTPIFMWSTLHYKGHHGLQREVQQCMRNSKYLKYRLQEVGVSSMLNELSSIVVFERPRDEGFIRHWQLSCQGNIAHICVVPNVTIEKLETFVIELVEKRSSWFNDGGNQPPCVASDIGRENCACPMHK